VTTLVRLLASALVALVLVPHASAQEPAGGEQAKRKALWAAFRKAKPKKIGDIDAYGENPSLTAICFSAGREVYLFSAKTGKVEVQVFMQLLPKINRITFREDKRLDKSGPGKGWFVLWANGEVKMNVMADK
jgi:hypothetical protein